MISEDHGNTEEQTLMFSVFHMQIYKYDLKPLAPAVELSGVCSFMLKKTQQFTASFCNLFDKLK